MQNRNRSTPPSLRRAAAAGACVALLLSACAGGVTKDAHYKSATDLRDALRSVGFPCGNWSDKDTSTNFDGGMCDGRQIRVYPSEQARAADRSGIIVGGTAGIVSANEPRKLVVGGNWVVTAPYNDAEHLASQIGGEVIDPSKYKLTELLKKHG